MGVRFDMTPLQLYYQYLDPVLLREELWTSLLYLHSQPPLFNVFLGFMLWLPDSMHTSFAACVWLAAGLAIACALYLLLLRLGARPTLAAVLAILFVISPSTLLYENWFFYSYLIAAVTIVAAVILDAYLQRRRPLTLAIFIAVLAVLSLTRSSFHVIWFAGIVAWLAYSLPAERKRVMRYGLVGLVAILLWYTKNAVVVGEFTNSTWLGMNIARITTFRLDSMDRVALVNDSTLSAEALVNPFSDLRYYHRIDTAPRFNSRAIDAPRKSNGETNFNHHAYIELAHRYSRNAVQTVIARPGAYVNGLVAAYVNYFMPASDYWFQNPNPAMLAGYTDVYNTAVLGQFISRDEYDASPALRTNWLGRVGTMALILVIVIPASFIACALILWRNRKRREHVTLGFIWLTTLWVTVASNAIDNGENNRFRFETDPMLIVLAGVAIEHVLRRRSGRV
ncbi:MAG: hypothetical protein H7X80_02100 [bacterium]|nr:hypothetical protein [Candidatus Kapabacteria bacterium]